MKMLKLTLVIKMTTKKWKKIIMNKLIKFENDDVFKKLKIIVIYVYLSLILIALFKGYSLGKVF